jgi:MFS family permease
MSGRRTSNFTRLWCVAAITNLGDGALLAAGPLLVASLTTEPAAVAGAMAAQQLPWLLFALAGGALADRLPRRRLIATVNLLRGAALGVLAVAVGTGDARLWLVYLVLFLLGTGETLADTAAGALVADVVPAERLGRANARLALTFSVGNQLVGPPLGALLFVAGTALPFGFHALAFGTAALVLIKMGEPGERSTGERQPLRTEVTEGLRWLWHNRPLRVLAGCILIMNLTGVGVFSIWVLYGREVLGLTDTEYGLFVATGSVGAIAGSWVYGRLETRFGMVTLLRGGLVVEAATYALLALTTSGVIAGVTMAVFGVHAVVWGTVSTTVRQRLTPSALLGRVTSVYLLASVGGAAVGAVLGGLVAQRFGLLTPFWIAALAVGLTTVLAWRALGTVRLRDKSVAEPQVDPGVGE